MVSRAYSESLGCDITAYLTYIVEEATSVILAISIAKQTMGFVGHDCYGVYTIFLMIVYTLEITWMHVRLYIFKDNTQGAKSTIMGVSVEV